MTEQELQEIKQRLELHDFAKTLHNVPMKLHGGFELPDHFEDIRRLLDEVERLQKQVEFNRNYGIYSNAMKEVERLRKALKEIAQAEPLSITHDIGYMQHIARKVLEGKE